MTRLMVVAGFAVAFLAGLVVGLTRVAPQLPEVRGGDNAGSPQDPPRDRGSWFAQQLSLTPEQQQQMKTIWDEASRSGHRQQREQRRKLREELEASIAALVRDEDRPRYEALQADYEAKVSAMEAEWRKSFQNAVDRTKQILTPDQRTKYEEILAKQQWDRDGGPRDRGRGTTRPTTMETR